MKKIREAVVVCKVQVVCNSFDYLCMQLEYISISYFITFNYILIGSFNRRIDKFIMIPELFRQLVVYLTELG